MLRLAEFLLARIAEDEAAARAASPGGWQYGDVASVAGGMLYDETRTIASLIYEQMADHDGTIIRHLLVPEADANGRHITRHDPTRVLAECEAKRRIVDDFAALEADYKVARSPETEARRFQALVSVAQLALVYADHDDYDETWRP